MTIEHQDDETVSGPGCFLAAGPQDDTVDASITHQDLSLSDSSSGAFEFQLNWHNSSILDTTVSNMTKSQIEMMLDGGGIGIGNHDLVMGVTVETGGGAGCQSDDDGQEVNYLIELVSLDYTIAEV